MEILVYVPLVLIGCCIAAVPVRSVTKAAVGIELTYWRSLGVVLVWAILQTTLGVLCFLLLKSFASRPETGPGSLIGNIDSGIRTFFAQVAALFIFCIPGIFSATSAALGRVLGIGFWKGARVTVFCYIIGIGLAICSGGLYWAVMSFA